MRFPPISGVCVVLAVMFVLSTTGVNAGSPEDVKFPSGSLILHGFVHRPGGSGPFPAVLYNHGSEKLPGSMPGLGKFFTRRGYVFFVPHRPGHGRSPGVYIKDLLDRERDDIHRSRKLVELQEEHVEDVVAALSYLKGLPYIDPDRIAVAGCSFGGIQTVLMAERRLGLRAAIDFAGAAQTWRSSPQLRDRMLRAVRGATVPILLIQAENDYDLSPSRALAKELEQVGKPHKLLIYPPYGTSTQGGHWGFCTRGGDIWGPEVFSFLGAAMPPR